MKKNVTKDNLRLMVFSSANELGDKVDYHLLKMYNLDPKEYTFKVNINELWFQDGHQKIEINDTVRGTDMFLLSDIGNYSVEYQMHGFTNHASPNDLFCQLKDGIGACNCHTENINIVMPLLYAGRQHRRNTREALACGAALRELDHLKGVKSFVTFDAHDQGVEHSIRNMEFENAFPTNTILTEFINDLPKNRLKKLVFVAPDNGATGRRNVYLNSFNSNYIHREAGSFVKQRDYNNMVDGKYPIISHDYSGNKNLDGYTAIVADDMIASGGSMFDVINELHKYGVEHIYITVTYALFTRGIDKFREAYENKLFDGIYTTNLSYIPEEYKKEKWLHVCDCSKYLAQIIYSIHNDLSISELLNDKSIPVKLLEEKLSK